MHFRLPWRRNKKFVPNKSPAKTAGVQKLVKEMQEAAKKAALRKQADPATKAIAGRKIIRPKGLDKEAAEKVAASLKRLPVIKMALMQMGASNKNFASACQDIEINDTKRAFKNAYRILENSKKGREILSSNISSTMYLSEKQAVKKEAATLGNLFSALIKKGHIKKEQLLQ